MALGPGQTRGSNRVPMDRINYIGIGARQRAAGQTAPPTGTAHHVDGQLVQVRSARATQPDTGETNDVVVVVVFTRSDDRSTVPGRSPGPGLRPTPHDSLEGSWVDRHEMNEVCLGTIPRPPGHLLRCTFIYSALDNFHRPRVHVALLGHDAAAAGVLERLGRGHAAGRELVLLRV